MPSRSLAARVEEEMLESRSDRMPRRPSIPCPVCAVVQTWQLRAVTAACDPTRT